jgi:hypothetical protein
MGRRPEQRKHADTGDPKTADVMPARSGSHPSPSPARRLERWKYALETFLRSLER